MYHQQHNKHKSTKNDDISKLPRVLLLLLLGSAVLLLSCLTSAQSHLSASEARCGILENHSNGAAAISADQIVALQKE